VWVLETKFLDPELGREVDYYDLCPGTPMIFFNHYWDGVPESPRWPKSKPLYLMPNIEMVELTPEHYWGVDAVLCKTRVCYDRVTRWYAENGNPRDAKVFYTKHTSSDQAEFARRRLGNASVAAKDVANVKFIHTAGTSVWKGTRELVDCWIMSSGMPQLDVYIDDSAYGYLFGGSYQRRLDRSRSPVHIEHGMLAPQDFSKLTAESAFFMCPSRSEGYGHYINQARASGGVVITTDAPPMNELIVSGEMGVLVPARSQHDPQMLLGGKFTGPHGLRDPDGLLVKYNSRGLCIAVRDFIASTTAEQRAAMGAKARKQYHQDTKFFARSMRELRQFART
jgi:glycosyltransferase involved in cell wall biosynthesis